MKTREQITYSVVLNVFGLNYDITEKCTLPENINTQINEYNVITSNTINITLLNYDNYFNNILNASDDLYVTIYANNLSGGSFILFKGRIDPHSICETNDDIIDVTVESLDELIEDNIINDTAFKFTHGGRSDLSAFKFTHGGRFDLYLKKLLDENSKLYDDNLSDSFKYTPSSGFAKAIGDYNLAELYNNRITDYTQSIAIENKFLVLFTNQNKLYALAIDNANNQTFLKKLDEFPAELGIFILRTDDGYGTYNSKCEWDENYTLTMEAFLPTLQSIDWSYLAVDAFYGIDKKPIDKIYKINIVYNYSNNTIRYTKSEGRGVIINSKIVYVDGSPEGGKTDTSTSSSHYILPSNIIYIGSVEDDSGNLYDRFICSATNSSFKHSHVFLLQETSDDTGSRIYGTRAGSDTGAGDDSLDVWSPGMPINISVIHPEVPTTTHVLAFNFDIKKLTETGTINWKKACLSRDIEINHLQWKEDGLSGTPNIVSYMHNTDDTRSLGDSNLGSDWMGLPGFITSWVKLNNLDLNDDNQGYEYYLVNLYYNGYRPDDRKTYRNDLIKVKVYVDTTNNGTPQVADSSDALTLINSSSYPGPAYIKLLYPTNSTTPSTRIYYWLTGNQIKYYKFIDSDVYDVTSFGLNLNDYHISYTVDKDNVYRYKWFLIGTNTTTTYDPKKQFLVCLNDYVKDLIIKEFGIVKKTTADYARLLILRDEPYTEKYIQMHKIPLYNDLKTLLIDTGKITTGYVIYKHKSIVNDSMLLKIMPRKITLPVDPNNYYEINNDYIIDKSLYFYGTDYFAGFRYTYDYGTYEIGAVDNNALVKEASTFIQEIDTYYLMREIRRLAITNSINVKLNLSGLDLTILSKDIIKYDDKYWFIIEKNLNLNNSTMSIDLKPYEYDDYLQEYSAFNIFELKDYDSFHSYSSYNPSDATFLIYPDHYCNCNSILPFRNGIYYVNNPEVTDEYVEYTINFPGQYIPVAIDVTSYNTSAGFLELIIPNMSYSGAYDRSTNKLKFQQTSSDYTLRIHTRGRPISIDYLRIIFKRV